MTYKTLMDVQLKHSFTKFIFICLIKFRFMVTKVIKLTIMKNEHSALGYNILCLQFLLISFKKTQNNLAKQKKKLTKQTNKRQQKIPNSIFFFFSPTVMGGNKEKKNSLQS